MQGSAERRLARLAGLESPAELWSLFDRANLLDEFPGRKPVRRKGCRPVPHAAGDAFPLDEAKRAAATFPLERFAVAVLLGCNVAKAFELDSSQLFHLEHVGATRVLVLPHPSGVSHVWNHANNHRRAEAALRACVAELQAPPCARRRSRPRRRLLLAAGPWVSAGDAAGEVGAGLCRSASVTLPTSGVQPTLRQADNKRPRRHQLGMGDS